MCISEVPRDLVSHTTHTDTLLESQQVYTRQDVILFAMPKKEVLEQKWWRAIRNNDFADIKKMCLNSSLRRSHVVSDMSLNTAHMEKKCVYVHLQEPLKGNSALHMAALRGDQQLAEMLLAYGANIELQNKVKETPLITALKNKRLLLVLLLYRHGANAACLCSRAQTPLHYACIIGDNTLVKKAIEKGCMTVNFQNDVGKTALHIAAEKGNLEAVILLLKLDDIDLFVRDEVGRAAVDLAIGEVGIVLDKEMRMRKRTSCTGGHPRRDISKDDITCGVSQEPCTDTEESYLHYVNDTTNAEDSKEAEKTFYEIMGVEKNFMPNELKKKYRKLAILWHPDKNLGEKGEEAQKIFSQINEAFTTLSNPRLRAAYNSGGKESVARAREDDIRAPQWKDAEDIMADFEDFTLLAKTSAQDLSNVDEISELEETLISLTSIVEETKHKVPELQSEHNRGSSNSTHGFAKKKPTFRGAVHAEYSERIIPHSAPLPKSEKDMFSFNDILSDL
eukprot:CFRG5959T1